MQQLQAVTPDRYARTRNYLNGAVTGLSPYLTHGLLTPIDVLSYLLQQQSLPVQHKLVQELGWREYYHHIWGHLGDGILKSLHAGPLPENVYDDVLPPDVRNGSTGLPVIDEAVRTLYTSGTLHNHARMWLASYIVHLRRIHWRAGADWLVSHLLDGNLASNHLSWQWIAGTGSHKPYLFNAENVARYAPPSWHSTGSVIDCSYAELDTMSRSVHAVTCGGAGIQALVEPDLLKRPPTALEVDVPDAVQGMSLAGREVWLLHPWSIRIPPADLPADTIVIGLYLRDYHDDRPWTEERWHWVDNAMCEVTPLRWWVDAQTLGVLLNSAGRVRSVWDPHLAEWLPRFAELDSAPALFRTIDRPCRSFSQWWKRVSENMVDAASLLEHSNR